MQFFFIRVEIEDVPIDDISLCMVIKKIIMKKKRKNKDIFLLMHFECLIKTLFNDVLHHSTFMSKLELWMF